MSWLSGHDIIKKILYNAGDVTWLAFDNIYSIDTLPKSINHYPCFIVVNTHTKNLSGQHWKAILIKEDHSAEVFDSLALPLSVFVENWLNKFTRKWRTNLRAYQHSASATCGAFVLYYILTRLNYHNFESFTKTFSLKTSVNEQMIDMFYKSLI